MALTTYGDLSPRTAAYAAKDFLERGQALLITERFGQIDPLGQNKTKSVTWRRYEALARNVAPLAEGIVPAGQKPTKTDITATLEQYGDIVWHSDVIEDTHEDPILQINTANLAETAAETIELVRIGHLVAGSNVYYANGVASRTLVTSAPTGADFKLIHRTLKRNRAKEISEIIAATANVSTQPVASAYFAMGHTDLESDLRAIPGFKPVENYSNTMKALPGEVGSFEHIRFILTQLFEPWLAAATSISAAQTTYLSNGVAAAGYPDVYPLIIVGKNAYALTPMAGKRAVTITAKSASEISVANPLGQKGFVAYKTYQTAAILNDLWMARLECCVTARPSSN